MNSPLLEKSMDFATQIVLFYEEFSKSKKDTTIAKQLLRSATDVRPTFSTIPRKPRTKNTSTRLFVKSIG